MRSIRSPTDLSVSALTGNDTLRIKNPNQDTVRDTREQQEIAEQGNHPCHHVKQPYGPLAMTLDELTSNLGGRRGRAQLVWDCYSIGVDPALLHGNSTSSLMIGKDKDDYEAVSRLLPSCRRTQKLGPGALENLSRLFPNQAATVSSDKDQHTFCCVEGGLTRLSHVSQSRDGTTKLLLQLADDLQVETVIIPWNGTRSTLCISSQVGCRQACRFCATGKMGIQRSLSSDEILAQMFWARKIVRWYSSNDDEDQSHQRLPPITNVVFMGMGEPADNVPQVKRAVEILTTRELFQFAASRVTVSTVAPTPRSFVELGEASCVLAWSVHAARDELRRALVPTTKYSMKELRDGLIEALLMRPPRSIFRSVMLEVALIDQVNDSLDQDAAALVELSEAIIDAVPDCKLVVNLIPYNNVYSEDELSAVVSPTNSRSYRAPMPAKVRAFQNYLWQHNVRCHIRTTRGDDESAACGQLATCVSRRDKNGTGNHAVIA